MMKLKELALMFSLALSVHSAQAMVIQDLYIFGDSLSDSGNLFTATGIPGTPYVDGRFTNGPNYADYLGQALGIPVSPSLLGGNNYAWGAARARGDTPITGGAIPGISTQVQLFVNAHAGDPIPPQALSIVFIGGNDVADAIDANLDSIQATPFFGMAIQEIINSITLLSQNGVQHFIVPLIPDLSLTPDYFQQSNAHMLSEQFDQMFIQQLGTLNDIDVDILDTPQIIADNFYRFSNTTTACLLDGCQNPDDYFFFDNFHPTTKAHLILSQAIVATVPNPNSLALMVLGFSLFLLFSFRSSLLQKVPTRKKQRGRAGNKNGYKLQS